MSKSERVLQEIEDRTEQVQNLGWFLTRVRTECGVAQNDLANSIGISPSELADIEAGRVWPTMPLFIDILGALGLPSWDPTDPVNVVHSLRSRRALGRLGLLEWMLTLTDDEMTLFATRGYEAVELGRALDVLHGKPLASSEGEPLTILFPERLSGFRHRAQREDD